MIRRSFPTEFYAVDEFQNNFILYRPNSSLDKWTAKNNILHLRTIICARTHYLGHMELYVVTIDFILDHC